MINLSYNFLLNFTDNFFTRLQNPAWSPSESGLSNQENLHVDSSPSSGINPVEADIISLNLTQKNIFNQLLDSKDNNEIIESLYDTIAHVAEKHKSESVLFPYLVGSVSNSVADLALLLELDVQIDNKTCKIRTMVFHSNKTAIILSYGLDLPAEFQLEGFYVLKRVFNKGAIKDYFTKNKCRINDVNVMVSSLNHPVIEFQKTPRKIFAYNVKFSNDDKNFKISIKTRTYNNLDEFVARYSFSRSVKTLKKSKFYIDLKNIIPVKQYDSVNMKTKNVSSNYKTFKSDSFSELNSINQLFANYDNMAAFYDGVFRESMDLLEVVRSSTHCVSYYVNSKGNHFCQAIGMFDLQGVKGM